MTPEMEALGRRAVACKGWRWMPGMRVDWVAMDTGWRMLSETRSWYEREECEDGKPGGPNALPDLTDPATLGCLLALVREAWRDSSIIAEPSLGMWEISRSDGSGLRTSGVWGGGGRGRGGFVFKPTEVDALVTALEVEGELTARGLAALKAAP